MSTTSIPTSIMPLKHRLLTLLALTATKGQNRVPLAGFFEIFADLTARYPDHFPGLYFNKTASYAYSKQLDSALQALVDSGVDIPNPSLRSIEVKDDIATKIIGRMKKVYGEDALKTLDPVADDLKKRVEDYLAV